MKEKLRSFGAWVASFLAVICMGLTWLTIWAGGIASLVGGTLWAIEIHSAGSGIMMSIIYFLGGTAAVGFVLSVLVIVLMVLASFFATLALGKN